VNSLAKRFAYDVWANLQYADALTQAGNNAPPKAAELLAHAAAASRLWLQRIHGEKTGEVWPRRSPAESASEFKDLAEGWRTLLSGGDDVLGRQVSYQNSKGEPWMSTVAEICEHVVIHGAYHRGQIALKLREAGIAPPYTDYIHAVRQGFI
jgi:uncharacterized damage-inducible protein DinB